MHFAKGYEQDLQCTCEQHGDTGTCSYKPILPDYRLLQRGVYINTFTITDNSTIKWLMKCTRYFMWIS